MEKRSIQSSIVMKLSQSDVISHKAPQFVQKAEWKHPILARQRRCVLARFGNKVGYGPSCMNYWDLSWSFFAIKGSNLKEKKPQKAHKNMKKKHSMKWSGLACEFCTPYEMAYIFFSSKTEMVLCTSMFIRTIIYSTIISQYFLENVRKVIHN